MNGICENRPCSRGELGILNCTAGEPFGNLILDELKKIFGQEKCHTIRSSPVPAKETHFPNTEVKIEIEDSVRGMDLYVVQDVENKESEKACFTEHLPLRRVNLHFHIPEGVDLETIVEVRRPFSVDENLRALFNAIDAARRSDAHYITAVVPVFPYARQDKAIARECITASKVAQAIENYGANRVLTLDMHNTAMAGFFQHAICENLHSSKMIIEYVRQNMDIENLIVLSPDSGGAGRAQYFAKTIGTKFGMAWKKRDYSKASTVEDMKILGEVTHMRGTLQEQIIMIKSIIADCGSPEEAIKRISEVLEQKAEGLDVLFVDDMIATAGSLVEGIKKVTELGAKSAWFGTALPLFTYPALDRIDDLYAKGRLQGVIGTNGVYHQTEEFKKKHPWYHEVHVERYFAEAIFNINHYKSISQLLK